MQAVPPCHRQGDPQSTRRTRTQQKTHTKSTTTQIFPKPKKHTKKATKKHTQKRKNSKNVAETRKHNKYIKMCLRPPPLHTIHPHPTTPSMPGNFWSIQGERMPIASDAALMPATSANTGGRGRCEGRRWGLSVPSSSLLQFARAGWGGP